MSRYGSQYPTACVYLSTDEDLKRSKGGKASALYSESGRDLLPWQNMLLEQMLAVNEEGLWVHADFGYTLPRRNGKSEDVIAVIDLVLDDGLKALYTAHSADTSHDFYERVELHLIARGFRKTSEVRKEDGVPTDQQFKSVKAKGAECIELLKTGGKIEFRTRTSTMGLGKAYALVIIDEAQEYTEEQQTAIKYVSTDYFNPMCIMCGTPPTLVSAGDVFKKYREDILNVGIDNAGWAEWSVEEKTDPNDINAWYLTNPSLGYILSERNIKREIKNPDDIDFQIQRLGLWYSYQIQSAITEEIWSETITKMDDIKLTGKLAVGIKFGISGENTCLSVACQTEDGTPFIQALACKPTIYGVSWIVELLKRLDYSDIMSDGKSGQEMLEKALKNAGLKHHVTASVGNVVTACAEFETAINNKKILHCPQVALDRVTTNTKKRKIGSGGGFGYDSIVEGYEIAILESAILAHHVLINRKEHKKNTAKYY